MQKIKYVGKHNCSVKLIDGGMIPGIKSGQEINVPDKDYESLKKLGEATKEWVEIKEVI